MQVRRPVAQGPQRAFHRGVQVICRIGKGPQPGQGDILGNGDAGQIAVIGPGLQRFRAAGCQDQFRHADLPKAGKTRRRQRFDGNHQRAPTVCRQHHRHTHAQVGPGPGKTFDDGRAKGHENLLSDSLSRQDGGKLKHLPRRRHERVKTVSQILRVLGTGRIWGGTTEEQGNGEPQENSAGGRRR